MHEIGVQFIGQFDKFTLYLRENTGQLLWSLLMAVMIFFLAKLALLAVSKGTKRVMESEKYHPTPRQGKRVDTIMTLTRSVARYAIYFTAFLLALSQFGMGKVTENLLVTAGIGSLALGIGAQNLVRDVVTGLFMMFENQFSVGDFIKTDEAEGTVEAAAMRVTYLRSIKGEQIIVPNGSISRVINYTRGGSVAIVLVNTPYEADTRAMIALIEQVVEEYAAQNSELIEAPPVVQGINAFNPDGAEIRVSCKTGQMKQWDVERGMRLAIKEAFDARGIKFPYRHVVSVPLHSELPLRGE